MSDWAVGDLAVCVDADPKPWNDSAQLARLSALEVGRSYQVIAIGVVARRSGPTIMLSGLPSTYDHLGLGWTASRFRKIRPDAREGSADDWALIVETTKRRVKA